MGKRNFESHDFYCVNCGRKALSLPRNRGYRHSTFHRKRLYCVFCKQEVNMVECKDEFETRDFLDVFEQGYFKEEAKESLSHCMKGGNK